MKILLDENIDVRFKKHLSEAHKVYTVQDMGWEGNEKWRTAFSTRSK